MEPRQGRKMSKEHKKQLLDAWERRKPYMSMRAFCTMKDISITTLSKYIKENKKD